MHSTVTLGYDLPWQTANDLLIKAANKTPYIIQDPKPFVYSELHKNILEVFDKAGVEILSPRYLAARDGSITAVPSKIKPDTRGSLDKVVDHLTGRNQKNIIKSSGDHQE